MTDTQTPPAPPRRASAGTVTVGCKLPNGVVLHLGVPGTDDYKEVKLNGTNTCMLVGPNNAPIPGSHGATVVSSEFMDTWLSKNTRSKLVVNGFVFCHAQAASVKSHFETAVPKHGLEQIDPAKGMPKNLEPFNRKD